MIKHNLFKEIISYFSNTPIIFTTGYSCREAYNIKDSENHFYMVGSMGMAATIGLGLSMTTEENVVVIDGDGSLLMNPNCLFMAADKLPTNFIHFVVDNNMYESTGGQKTISESFNFNNIAKSIGYRNIYTIENHESLYDVLENIPTIKGPTLIWAKVDGESSKPGKRVEITLPEIYQRFKNYVAEEK